MLDNNFHYNPLQTRNQNNDKEPAKTTNAGEKVKSKSEISWVELMFIIVAGMLFVFALTARIIYEYRTDDNSNMEVVVGSCTFKNNVLIKYDGSESIVNIPTCYEIDGEKYGITEIAYEVFYNNPNIVEINMPNQITRVGLFAFQYCRNLKKITLSDKLETLGDSCFWGCLNLETIHLPASLKTIEPYAFWNTSIKEIDIPESVKEIGLGAFNQCQKLETVYIRSNELVETWFTDVYQAFSNCSNLKTIYVPESLIEEYKTAQFWSLYADKFQAIGGVNNA